MSSVPESTGPMDGMLRHLSWQLHWILRVSVAACFIGHGAFGIITKPEWLPFFVVVGIGSETAYTMMPLIGMMDISLGLVALFFRPNRLLLTWMVIWCAWTALLRPLAGMGVWEFFERAGNYGVPLAFLVMIGWSGSLKGLLGRIHEVRLTDVTVNRLMWALRITTATLLIGHGGFAAIQKKQMLIDHFASAGICLTLSSLTMVGWFEIALGVATFFRPARPLLMFIFFWKVGTELLYPLSGTPIWEFVERTGSYGAPLALFFLQGWKEAARIAGDQVSEVVLERGRI